MLNDIEQTILNIFINVYELKSTNYVSETNASMNIKFDEEHITSKLLSIFFDRTTNYISNILEFALTYLLLYDEDITIFENKININELDENSKRDILNYAIKFLLLKRNNSINKKSINKVKDDNITLFSKIDGYKGIRTITQLYRQIIEDLANKKGIKPTYRLLERILFSDEYDKDIINISNNLINDEIELKQFKLFMIRIILCDVYIYEADMKKKAIKQMPSNMFPPGIPLELLEISSSTPILEHVKWCTKNNKYFLPKDEFLKKHIIEKYLAYNEKDNTNLINDIEKDHRHILKKVNPFYEFDKLF